MKVSTYIVNYLESLGIKVAFGITGSVIAPLFDAFHGRKNIQLIHPIHEQAAAMSAHAYTFTSGIIGVAISTSGPGATNLLTGLTCCWFDSVPGLFITGQVNSKFTKGTTPVRQVGFQETAIVPMVQSVTKYAVQVLDPQQIRYELEKAVYMATHGRPGPVLIDLPGDIQSKEIHESTLRGFTPPQAEQSEPATQLQKKIRELVKDLQKAKRPVILLGGGVRHGHAAEEFKLLLKTLKVPVVATWAAMDILEEVYPLYRGRIGTYGQRGANFTIQNADLLLSLGSGHSGRQTGGIIDSFAREAKRYIVDIDADELAYQQVKGHVNIQADLKEFIPALTHAILKPPRWNDWLKTTQEWKDEYTCVAPEYKRANQRVNTYAFMELLSELTEEHDVIVGDCGGNIVPMAQAYKVKKGQTIVTSWSHSPMGYAFAASFGAYYAKSGKAKNVICTIGDGGMQVNIQELQTLKMYNLPIKVFVLDNESYGIIQQFQDIYLKGRYVGAAPGWGYTVPDFRKVAEAYGLKTEMIHNWKEAPKVIKKVLKAKGPVICTVKLAKKTVLVPRLGWNSGIEDQFPFLEWEELKKHLYIKPMERVKQ